MKMKTDRRQFLAMAASSCLCTSPNLAFGNPASSAGIVGKGQYQYKMDHDFLKLPNKYQWQTTHNVAVDNDNNLYVIHEGDPKKKDHPSIFVFDSEGKFIRAFGNQFQGGGHGLEIRSENGEEYLYVTAYQALKTFAKLTLKGKTVWQKFAPMESERYAKDEDKKRTKSWGRDRFMPTNIAFHPDGGFFVADGYGAWCIHRYDKDATYVSTFGRPGKKDGEFSLPHGIWIDLRSGQTNIVIADRANARLQWFDLDGNHKKTMNDFILPANVDSKGELLLVPDLASRVTLINRDNKIVAQLGDDENWRSKVKKDGSVRTKPKEWKQDRFIHPHDACFDKAGNIYVAEWVGTGRVTKLTKV